MTKTKEQLELEHQSKLTALKEKVSKKVEDIESFLKFRDQFFDTYHVYMMEDNDDLWVYDEQTGIWILEPMKHTINDFCVRIPFLANSHHVREMITNIKGMRHKAREDFEPFEFICLQDGVIDLNEIEYQDNIIEKSLIIHEFEPGFNLKTKLSFSSTNKNTCLIWLKFLSEVMPAKDVLLLQEWFGYHFYKSAKEKKAMFIVGATNTGKSIISNVLHALIGKQNITGHSLRDLSGRNPYAVADFYNKTANICPDMTAEYIEDDDIFKKLTGRDYLQARQIYEKGFAFKPQIKLTFICNKLPELSKVVDQDPAFWGRILIINLPQEVPIEKRNKDLEDEIINNELFGILLWAIKGLRRLELNGFNYNDEHSYEFWEDLMRIENPLTDFLDEHVVYKANGIIKKDLLRNFYKDWCKHLKKTEISSTMFGISMKQIGYTDTRVKFDGKQRYCWVNCELRSTPISEYKAPIIEASVIDTIDAIEKSTKVELFICPTCNKSTEYAGGVGGIVKMDGRWYHKGCVKVNTSDVQE